MLSGLGLSEILIILLVTLIVIGPEKIPEVARMLGKGVREVRRASNMFRDMFMLEETNDYRRRDRRQDLGGKSLVEEHDSAGVAGSVSREPSPPVRISRPVLLDPPRRATGVTEVELASPTEAKTCNFEPLSAPSRQQELAVW